MSKRGLVRRLAGIVAAVAVASAPAYTVRGGDTLSTIAGRHDTSVEALAALNDLSDPNLIYPGQVLSLPDAPGDPGAPADTHEHVVRPGQTLSGIASTYGISLAELAAANGISNPNRIIAGARLAVPGSTPDQPAQAATVTHVVRPGETLSGIAKDYGVSIAELTRANGISNPNRIVAGARLAVPGGWRCPVQGTVEFIDDYGVSKPDGRIHEGVDVFAPRGTPVVAPVAGTAEHVEGDRGGLQVWLYGDDETLYISTHLDSLAASGKVAAGEVVGTVGTTGNAAATSPHVHFEVLPEGGPPTNPFPLLVEACQR